MGVKGGGHRSSAGSVAIADFKEPIQEQERSKWRGIKESIFIFYVQIKKQGSLSKSANRPIDGGFGSLIQFGVCYRLSWSTSTYLSRAHRKAKSRAHEKTYDDHERANGEWAFVFELVVLI